MSGLQQCTPGYFRLSTLGQYLKREPVLNRSTCEVPWYRHAECRVVVTAAYTCMPVHEWCGFALKK
jgi:hypothetical protein